MCNNQIKKGSAGGKATGLLNRKKAMERIDEYNKNPNLCLCCNNPILAEYGKSLSYTLVKKFCSQSCAAKYNNLHYSGNRNNGANGIVPIINDKTDEEIIEAYNSSRTLSEFRIKLGYKNSCGVIAKSLKNRLDSLGLDINEVKDKKKINNILSATKDELFGSYSNWQTARSLIQKMQDQYMKIHLVQKNV